MTEITRWLLGLFIISGGHALFYLLLTTRGQLAAGVVTWRDSAPTRLALSMIMLILALVFFALGVFLAPTMPPRGYTAGFVWSAWFIAWLSALTALSGLRRGSVKISLCLNVLWTIGFLTWQGYFR